MKKFMKKLFYKRKGNTKKYKLLGLTLVSITKKANKKIIKIFGVKFSKQKNKKMPEFHFSSDLKSVKRRFEYNKKYKKLAIFASFNKEGLIADYVVYYLQGLKKVVDGIIFVADNPVLPSEIEKLKNLVVYAQCERHGKYDFGSYKCGYLWAQDKGLLDDTEELVFCNDSCYGPVYPFTEMFEEMGGQKCDFWGICKNVEISPHIQSYFLVFKPQVFLSEVFINFIRNIKHQSTVREVITKYEVGLSKILFKHGFVGKTYIQCYGEDNIFSPNQTLFPVKMMKNKSPLVKVKALNEYGCNYDGINNTIDYINEHNSVLGNIVQKKYMSFPSNEGFSIIMPTYNRADMVCQAIDAVMKQTYKNFELLVVDDGSTDDTEYRIRAQYAQELNSGKLKYFHKEHEGVCKARNYALARAKEKWIAYCDSDNIMFPHFLEVYMVNILRHPEEKIFYAQWRLMSDKRTMSRDFNYDDLLAGNYIDMGVFVHLRDFYTKCGGFDENLTRLEDWDLILKYTSECKPFYIQLPVLMYSDRNDAKRVTNLQDGGRNFAYIKKKYCRQVVSTVITSYNHEEFIAQAIKSAIQQQGNFIHEIIISDDGSTDNTHNIIKMYAKKYPDLIKDISSSKNIGISANIKKCFTAASGQYIALLEGDDYWVDCNKLEIQRRILNNNHDLSMVFNRSYIFDELHMRLEMIERQDDLPEVLSGKDILHDEYQNPVINLSSCMFVAKYIKNLPDELYSPRLSEVLLSFYLEKFGSIGYIASPLSVYRQHAKGTWTGADIKSQLQSIIRERKIAVRFCKDNCRDELKKIIQEKEDELMAVV